MANIGSDDFAWMRHTLYCAVVADVLDGLGLRNQVPDVALAHLCGHPVLAGRAKTLAWEDIFAEDSRPYELELKAVDECQLDDVLVSAAAGSMRSGIWGELLSTAARHRGCAGALVDGAVRDVGKMHAMNFTVFARGACPRDSLHRQRVTAIDVPVRLGGVTILPGDLIVADSDGMVVVPSAVEVEVLAKARDKVAAENHTRDEIRQGMKATDVFRKYGVL